MARSPRVLWVAAQRIYNISCKPNDLQYEISANELAISRAALHPLEDVEQAIAATFDLNH